MSEERMRKILTVAGIAATLGLAGCGDGLDDLRAEIDKAKQRPGGRIQPLPEVRPYVSHEYQMADRRSPFLQSLAGESPRRRQLRPRPDQGRADPPRAAGQPPGPERRPGDGRHRREDHADRDRS
jgi:Tfp pilus assembly protein PilP